MKIDGDQGLVDQETNEPSQDSKLRPEVCADENLPLANIAKGLVLGEKMVAAVFLLVVIITMASQVVARYVFGSPFQWSEEVARLALIWMTFVSAAYVMAEGRHIAVDMISSRLNGRGNILIECLGYLVVAIACLLLCFGGAKFVWYVGKVGSPALGVPKSWWYGAGMVGLLLIAFHSIVNLVQVWVTGKPLVRDTQQDEEAFQLQMEHGK